MPERWTAEDRKATQMTGFGWGLVVVLGLAAFTLLGYSAYRITAKAIDTTSIIGEWQADDPPWHAVFRADNTVGMIFNGKTAPSTLAPLVMTPGLEVPGKFGKSREGVYQVKLQNGKVYEASIGKLVPDRFDLTDADGASAVITFRKMKPAAQSPD